MIVKLENMLVCDVIGIERAHKINGENRYGVNLYIRGGGFMPFKTGTEEKLKGIISKLGDILIEERMMQARNNDSTFEYIVAIEDAVVKSKQLLTEDKAQRLTNY